MCGRFPQAHHAQQYRASVAPQLPRGRQPRQTRGCDTYHASHNVAPNSYVPVVRCLLPGEDVSSLQVEHAEDEHLCDGTDTEPSIVIMQTMRWGLLPRHQKQLPTFRDTMNTINARDDTLLSGSPLWSRPFNNGQRCIVFVQGFYEWLKKTKGSGVERIPHFVGMHEQGVGRRDRDGKERKMMPLAGLWERCRPDGESEERFTFTIITTDVSAQLDFLHDRQPLILPSVQAIATWLDPKAPLGEVRKLVKSFDGKLQFYKVPKEVGKVGNDDPSFLLPVEDRKDGLMAAFGRAQKSGKIEMSTERLSSANDTNSETNAPAPKEGDIAGQDVRKGKLAEADGSEADGEASVGATKKEQEIEQVDSPKGQRPDDLLEATEVVEKKAMKLSSEPVSQDGGSSAMPSSRWSPDPWNPPVSPPRPNGGYSTTEDPHSGLSKYGSVKREEGQGSPFKRKTPEVKMGEGALEHSFKKQKVKRETEEELGIHHDHDVSGRRGFAEDGKEVVSPSRSHGSSPTSRRKNNHASSPSKAQAQSKCPAPAKRNGGQGDIRAFFSSP